MKDTKRNYHASLSQLRDDLDPLLKLMKDKENLDSWLWQALWGPVKSVIGLFKQAKGLSKLSLAGVASIPFVGTSVAGVIANFSQAAIWQIVLLCAVVFSVIYGFYVQAYIGKMISPGNKEFHLGLFKRMRKAEYERYWERIVNSDDFTFAGLNDFVSSVFGIHSEEENQFVQHLKDQVAELKSELQVYESQFQEYDHIFKDLTDAKLESDMAIHYLMELIKDLNITLYRFANGRMSFSDLAFITGFTIYENRGDHLIKVADERTTATSPDVIYLDDPDYEDYAVVNAAQNIDSDYYLNSPYPGHFVLAHTLKMWGNKVWHIAFHIDEKNKKALFLTLENDTIEIREMYRIFHVLCLILYSKIMRNEGGVTPDEQAEANQYS